MDFPDGMAFTHVFGPGMTARQLAQTFGIAPSSAIRMASDCGIQLRSEPFQVVGLEHLPGIPVFTDIKTWAGGTWYRVDCERAGDSPGYRSLLIHLSKTSQDNDDEEAIHE